MLFEGGDFGLWRRSARWESMVEHTLTQPGEVESMAKKAKKVEDPNKKKIGKKGKKEKDSRR